MMNKIISLLAIIIFCRAAGYADAMGIQAEETLFNPPFERGPFVEMLLKHSSGKCAGYDKKTRKILAELPGGCYAEQGVGENPKMKTLVYSEPWNGTYVLYIEANESGIYQADIDIMVGEEYISKSVSGLVAGGDIQEVEINYSADGKTLPDINKKVDVYLLKREIEIALKKGRLDKALGKELVRNLMHLERALMNKANADARNVLKIFICKLANRREQFGINNSKDIKTWFTGYFTENPNDMQQIFFKRDIFFLNISNINENKKSDWFEARSVTVLLEDAKTLLENIAI